MVTIVIYLKNGIEVQICEGDEEPTVPFANWVSGQGETREAAIADARDAIDWQAELASR